MSFNNSDVLVRFGADASGMNQGSKAAEAAMSESISKMERLFDGLHQNVEANTKAVNAAVKQMGDHTDRSFSGMKRSVSVIGGAFKGLGAMLAGGALWAGMKAFVKISDEYTDLAGRLRLVTASTKELAAAQEGLYEVAKRTRGDYSATVDLYTRFARSTETLGISQQELLRVTEAVNKAIVVSGSSTESAKAALIQLGQGMASGTLRGEELNSVMEQTPRLARMIAEGMGVSIGELRALGAEGKITAEAVFDALSAQAGAVDEEFAQMNDTVARAGKYFETVFKGVIDGANQAEGTTNSLAEAIITMADTIEENKEGLIEAFAAIGEAVSWLIERVAALGNAVALFKGMQEGKVGFFEWMTADAEDARQILERIREEEAARKSPKPAEPAGEESVRTPRPATKTGSSEKGEQSQMGVWQRALEAQKLYYDETGQLRELSMQEEQAYWQQVLDTQKMSAKDRERVESSLSKLKMQLLQKELKEQKALSAEAINEAERAALAELEIEERTLKTKLESGRISQREYLAALRGFKAQEYQIEATAQEKRIALAADDPNNPVNYQKALNRLAEIKRKHLKVMGDLTDKTVKEEEKKWRKLNKSIGDGLGGAIGDWMVGLSGTMDMLTGMLRSVQQAFSNIISEMVSRWVQGLLQMLFTKQTTDAASTASTATAAAATTAAKTTEATAVVGANAAEAASGAAASQAAIPIVGPELAAVAFAAVMALTMGAMSLMSAEGGYDIPAGSNPLTQLHQKEMVLPAKYAEVIRNMEGGKGGSHQPINVTISSTDAVSVRRLFNQHKDELVRSLRNAARNGSHLKR